MRPSLILLAATLAGRWPRVAEQIVAGSVRELGAVAARQEMDAEPRSSTNRPSRLAHLSYAGTRPHCECGGRNIYVFWPQAVE